jgi:predicted transcriptional regulator
MELRLSADLQGKLSRIAVEHGRDSESLVVEAVERFVNHDEWFVREVEEGLAAAERGELLDHEEIKRVIDRRYPG